MDLSRYSFVCQKAFHQGLQLCRSLGHRSLEVEHVALAVLRSDELTLTKSKIQALCRHLQKHLGRQPRIFGSVKIAFGVRLDRALDVAEAQRTADGVVEIDVLWRALSQQSTVIGNVLGAEDDRREELPHEFRKQGRTSRGKVVGGEFQSMLPNSDGPSESDESSADDADRSTSQPSEEGSPLPNKLEKKLRKYTVDLSAIAERGEFDPIIGRETEVRRVLEIIGRKKKNNPILIGDPGVGKSAIAEAIAMRIADHRVPERMRGRRVLSLDLGSLLAGSRYRGEFEQRIKDLIEALEQVADRVILFIDEIHTLVGAGNKEGGADAANLLKPALARGELNCIGATTLDEYRKYIEADAALERRFQPVFVDEPSAETALSMLRGIKPRYEIHHGIRIDDEALSTAVDMSIRYLGDRRLPDKAIDLIDEAASRMRLQVDSVPAILGELQSLVETLEIERKAIGDDRGAKRALAQLDAKLATTRKEYSQVDEIWRKHQALLEAMQTCEKQRQESESLFVNAKSDGNFDLAAKLQYEEIPELEGQLQEIRDELDALQVRHGFLRQTVGAPEVAEVLAQWTRIPVQRLLQEDTQRLGSLRDRLATRVFGQDQAIEEVARAVSRARVGIAPPDRPRGVFLFLGPTGVGKTQTAKSLAADLFHDPARMVRIDMSEYKEAHSVARLIGSPPGYVGYGDGGQLTEPVRRRPFSIVLLDEVEKAHPEVLDILLQVFDDGRLTDSSGRLVDFRNTFIIMTSNIPLPFADPVREGDEQLRKALATPLRPELVNRIDSIVPFRPLGPEQFALLCDHLTEELNGRLADRQMRLTLGAKLREALIQEATASLFGGRALRRAFDRIVCDAVAARILEREVLAIGSWTIDIDPDGGVVWRTTDRSHYYLEAPPTSRG